MTSSLAHRPVTSSDLPLVYGTWLDSFRTSPDAGQIPMSSYKAVYTDVIDRLLARAGVTALVAYRPGADAGVADLYGWAVVERGVTLKHRKTLYVSPLPVVHYCYVMPDYRRRGIASGLLEAAGVDVRGPFLYTFSTPVVARLPIRHAQRDHLVARYPKERRA